MRAEGWESRLAQLLEDAADKPYELGVHDCVKLACDWVASATGRPNRWPEIDGYRTTDEAVALIRAHGRTFEEAFDWLFGVTHQPARLARRGDIVAIQPDPKGMKHLGICVGTRVALLAADGLTYWPLAKCLCHWRI